MTSSPQGDSPQWDLPGVEASWCAGPVGGEAAVGHREDDLVTPASVMKVQVALAASVAIETARLDGSERVVLSAENRTPGPVGMSLMADPVVMSARDLLVPMMTLSDNVATDALLGLLGLADVNATTERLGLPVTWVAGDLATMLDEMAGEAGFEDYADLARHDPAADGPPTDDTIRAAIVRSAALDPTRGSRTTPAEMVRLLRLIWSDAAGPPPACARMRTLMGQQLTRDRIASGFDQDWTVAAKSGALMGVVRNEVGVVTEPSGSSYALAIFTRRPASDRTDPRDIDRAIGCLARRLVDQLQTSTQG